MGQYYKPTIQAIKYDKNRNQTRKLFSIAHDLKYGVKLCEHTDKDSQVGCDLLLILSTNLINKVGQPISLVRRLCWTHLFGEKTDLYGSLKYTNNTIPVKKMVLLFPLWLKVLME